MGTPTNYYVRPTGGSDSPGGGTSHATAYKTIQYALDDIGTTHGRDATNGDQINICGAGDEGDDVLSGTLSYATYGTPTAAAPVVFRGYESTANDGGVGGVDCNGSYSMLNQANNFTQVIDLHIHNSGSQPLLSLSDNCAVINCELNDTTADAINIKNTGLVAGNYIHDVGDRGIRMAIKAASAYGNYLKNGVTNKFTEAIGCFGDGCHAINNIISIDGSSVGIGLSGNWTRAINNSILSQSGTGAGITTDYAFNGQELVILNNLVEGFSGTGGKGFELIDATSIVLYGHNAAYNNTTEYDVTDDVACNLGDNETLSSSPFAKQGSDTLANRFAYFEPLDVGNVRAGAWPSGGRRDKGAVQHADPAGGSGGLLMHPGMAGGMSG